MSPSWADFRLRDHYVAVLTPAGATLVRRRRGLHGDCDLKADQPAAASDGSPLAAALAAADALALLLQRPEVGRGDLSIVLSNHFVRYQVVPWSDAVSTPEELAALARVGFEKVFGGEAAGWQIEIAPEAAGKPRLAAAVASALVERLRSAAAGSRLRLKAMLPYLVSAYNRLGEPARHDDVLFVLAEPGRACLLVATGGHWRGVRTSASEDTPEALAGLIERECQLLGLTDENTPQILVHAPQRARMPLPTIGGSVPRALAVGIPASLSAVADPQLAMAMTVA